MILTDSKTRVIVQGLTGHHGQFHAKAMLDYGTRIVGGVTPGKAGERVHGIPVFDRVADAPKADASVVFVPAPHAKEAVLESLAAGLLTVVITEHVPVHDAIAFAGPRVVGPNCPGLLSPGGAKLGIIPGQVGRKGRVGIVSRSGTLTYEIASSLSAAGVGQSTIVGIGGDAVIGLHFTDVLSLFERDKDTDAVVLIGEIGGDLEERAAAFAASGGFTKPLVAFVAGRTAPPGRTMGHAGAIVSRGSGSAESKIKSFRRAGVPVARLPWDVPRIVEKLV
jgi:succinyl-CoA synthetase alpha subunit